MSAVRGRDTWSLAVRSDNLVLRQYILGGVLGECEGPRDGGLAMNRTIFYGMKRRRFLLGLFGLLGAVVPGMGRGRDRSGRRSSLREAAFYRRLDKY